MTAVLKSKKQGLNEYQKIIAAGYEGGEFDYVASLEEAMRVGDGLFSFLMAELSDAEGCDCLDTAICRLEAIEREVGDCLSLMYAIHAAGRLPS